MNRFIYYNVMCKWTLFYCACNTWNWYGTCIMHYSSFFQCAPLIHYLLPTILQGCRPTYYPYKVCDIICCPVCLEALNCCIHVLTSYVHWFTQSCLSCECSCVWWMMWCTFCSAVFVPPLWCVSYVPSFWYLLHRVSSSSDYYLRPQPSTRSTVPVLKV